HLSGRPAAAHVRAEFRSVGCGLAHWTAHWWHHGRLRWLALDLHYERPHLCHRICALPAWAGRHRSSGSGPRTSGSPVGAAGAGNRRAVAAPSANLVAALLLVVVGSVLGWLYLEQERT